MVRHADWKADACATVTVGPRERNGWLEYVIDFDEPQADFTDEMNGLVDRTYKSTTVLAEYLQALEPQSVHDAGETTHSSWRDVRRFYGELLDSGWKLLPLKELANSIHDSDLGARTFASTSHTALGISTASRYHERLKRPMVYIEYNSETERFAIHFQEHQGQPDHVDESRSPSTDGTLTRIQAWLGVERR
jgi:hypothetical protein